MITFMLAWQKKEKIFTYISIPCHVLWKTKVVIFIYLNYIGMLSNGILYVSLYSNSLKATLNKRDGRKWTDFIKRQI